MAEPNTDTRRAHVKHLIDHLRVRPGTEVRLPHDFDPRYKPEVLSKDEAPELLAEGVSLLAEYQDRLYAQDTYSVLVVLQAMDAAGKDGTIKHVMSGVNPQGVNVHSFKSPSTEELDHEFLWRCAHKVPAKGMIGIFNRSYYEEVLVVRVHPKFLSAQHLPPSAVKEPQIWRRRFREINDWERYLTDNGTKIIKIFLNVSRDEQARRFLSRIDDPAKNWKFSPADMVERGFWDDYQRVYSEMLSHTSTDHAPWYVVPADRKWFARLATVGIISDVLMDLNPQYPTVAPEVKAKLGEMKKQLEAELPLEATE
jgi:PPK2 family polyphosphate:nucleotide phosphotransferase